MPLRLVPLESEGETIYKGKNIKLYHHYSYYYIFNFFVFLEPWEGAGTKFFGIFAIITICYTYKKINYLNMKNWISPLIACFQFLLCKPCTSIQYIPYMFAMCVHTGHTSKSLHFLSKVEWCPSTLYIIILSMENTNRNMGLQNNVNLLKISSWSIPCAKIKYCPTILSNNHGPQRLCWS